MDRILPSVKTDGSEKGDGKKKPKYKLEEKATEVENTPPVPNSPDIYFDTKETIELFRERDYEIRITSSTRKKEQDPVTVILDIGARSNLVDKYALPE